MMSAISSDAILAAVISVGIAVATGVAIILKLSVSALLNHMDRGFVDQDKVNKETLGVVREVHNKVDSHAERLAYLEGLGNLPLGSGPRKAE